MTWYASEAAPLLLVFQLPAGHMALSDFDCGFSAEAGSRLSGGVHAGKWLLETDGREGRRRTIGGDNGEKVQSSTPPLNTHSHSHHLIHVKGTARFGLHIKAQTV